MISVMKKFLLIMFLAYDLFAVEPLDVSDIAQSENPTEEQVNDLYSVGELFRSRLRLMFILRKLRSMRKLCRFRKPYLRTACCLCYSASAQIHRQEQIVSCGQNTDRRLAFFEGTRGGAGRTKHNGFWSGLWVAPFLKKAELWIMEGVICE